VTLALFLFCLFACVPAALSRPWKEMRQGLASRKVKGWLGIILLASTTCKVTSYTLLYFRLMDWIVAIGLPYR
jgi:hypothetical protein